MSILSFDYKVANQVSAKCELQESFETKNNGEILCVSKIDMEQRYKKPRKNLNVMGKASNVEELAGTKKLILSFPVDANDLDKLIGSPNETKKNVWGAEKKLKTLTTEPTTASLVLDCTVANAFSKKHNLGYVFSVQEQKSPETTEKGDTEPPTTEKGSDTTEKDASDTPPTTEKGSGTTEKDASDTTENANVEKSEKKFVLSILNSEGEKYYGSGTVDVKIFGRNFEIINEPTDEDLKMKIKMNMSDLTKFFGEE